MKTKRFVAFALVIMTAFISCFCFSVWAIDENLAKNMVYSTTMEAPTENAFPNLAHEDPDYKLTDGAKASASAPFNDSKYVEFYRGTYVNIDFEFATSVFVNGFKCGFYSYSSAGVYAPREVFLYVSMDGIKWFEAVSDINQHRPADSVRHRIDISASSKDYYEAKYVRVRFSSDVFSSADEIEVFGVKNGVTGKAYTAEEFKYKDSFASNNNPAVDNIKHTVLIYNGAYYNGKATDLGSSDESDLLPYVAYLDENNAIIDTMFDSVLFLPLQPGDCNTNFSYKKGWDAYLDNTIGAYDKPINLSALNRSVKKVKEALKLEDSYKMNVFISVPYIENRNIVFGYDSNNRPIKPTTLDNRLNIIKDYIDSAVKAFTDAQLDNLNLTGFYWYSEAVPFYASTHEIELVKGFNEYVHTKDYGTIWIPYYCTPGVTMWEELGFDCVCMQSGYAFPKDKGSETGDAKPETVMDSMSFSQRYGMGVEFEISSADYSRYSKYLEASAKLGCMKSGVTMYYQEGNTGIFKRVYNSSNYRHLYDDTYKYIKGVLYSGVPEMNHDHPLYVPKNSQGSVGKLPVTDSDTNKYQLKIESITKTTHGKLVFDADGFYQYIPDKDFVGTDSFSFTLTDGINTSKDYTVNIVVDENVIPFNGTDTKLRSEKVIIYTQEETSGTQKVENEKLYEVSVASDGTVVEISEIGNLTVPKNGYVISASGSRAEELKKLSSSVKKITLDIITKTVYLKGVDDAEKDEASEEQSISDVSAETSKEEDKSSDNTTTIIIIAVIATLVIVGVAVILISKKKHK